MVCVSQSLLTLQSIEATWAVARGVGFVAWKRPAALLIDAPAGPSDHERPRTFPGGGHSLFFLVTVSVAGMRDPARFFAACGRLGVPVQDVTAGTRV